MSARNVFGFAIVALLAACGPKVASLEISQKVVTLTQAGQEQVVTPVAKDEQGNVIEKARLSFTSSAEDVATVDASGKVAAVKTGDAMLKIAASDTVNVEIPVRVMLPATMAIAPSDAKVMPNERTMLRARILDEKQREVPGMNPEWASADPAVVTVTRGVVMGVKTGETKVTATLGELKAEANVTVLAAINAVEVKGLSLDLKKNTVGKLAPVAKDEKGTVIANPAFSFKTSDEKIVTVDPMGEVKAIGKGKAKVTVMAGGKEAVADVVVK